MPGRTTAERWAPVIVGLTLLFAAYALVIAVTGGFDLRIAGGRVRSRAWERPAIVAALGAAWLAWLWRRRVYQAVLRAWVLADSVAAARALTIAAAAWVAIAVAAFGAFAVGGSDSYGYVSQARLFAQGRLTDAIPSGTFSWPDVDATLTPLAYRRGLTPGVIVPTYPPGLALLMAPLSSWETGVHWVVPLFGLLAIWLTFRTGVRLGDPLAGGVAAVLLSMSPTFLLHVFQPMSDVPATACWMAALLLAGRPTSAAAAASGALVSLAVLVRPNLAPLAGVVALALIQERKDRSRRLSLFVIAMMPAIAALGWIQQVRYGSVWASGYGSAGELFSVANVRPNLSRYPGWLNETHTPIIWLWIVAPFWIVRRSAHRAWAWAAWTLTAAVWILYLPYGYFGEREWYYTRFLLPAIPLMLVFASAIGLATVRRLPIGTRAIASVILLAATIAAMAGASRSHNVFEIRAQEQRYAQTGAFVRDRLPATVFVLAVQHSGSIRYYANRPTLRWDMLDAGRLDQVLATLRASGFTPVLVADADEVPEFRARFGGAGQHGSERLSSLGAFGNARVYAFE